MSDDGKMLFVVTVTSEYVVLADSEDDACEIARRAHRNSDQEEDFEAFTMTYLPAGWDGDCLVYGDHQGDLTVDQAVDAGHAPDYEVVRKRLQKLHSKE